MPARLSNKSGFHAWEPLKRNANMTRVLHFPRQTSVCSVTLSSEHATPQNRSLHNERELLHLTPTPIFPFVFAEDSFSLYSFF